MILSRLLSWLLFDVIGALPFGIREIMGNIAGVLIPFVARKETEVINLQISYFLSSSDGTQKISSHKVFGHFAAVFLSALQLTPILNRGRFVWESKTGVTEDEIQHLPKGALALTAHIGNWDLLGAYFAKKGVEVSTIGRRARSDILQPVLEKLRIRNGIHTIWRDQDANPKKILALFKGKKILAALIDQDTEVRSVFSPFFDVPVKTPAGLVELALRFSSTIYAVFLVRESRYCYRLYIERSAQNRSEDEILRWYHQELESVIRRHPEQWAWFHKRWRSTPEEGTLGTTAYIKKLSTLLKKKIPVLLISIFLPFLTFSIGFSLTGCSLFSPDTRLNKEAETLRSDKKFDEAIEKYRAHIEERLRESERETWENPYFYLLLIGDIYLEKGDLLEAEKTYRQALEKNVEKSLGLDRMLQLAEKYEELGEYKKAIELLTPFTDEDPILINAVLDRISKKLSEFMSR